jgi:hypothetical protein
MVVAYSIKGDSFVAEKPREWITKIDGTTWEPAELRRRTAAEGAVAALDIADLMVFLKLL